MEETPFFRLIEERSPEEIADDMRHAFGPNDGLSSGITPIIIIDEAKEELVLETMEKMMLWMQGQIGIPRHLMIENTSPNRLYISKLDPLVSVQ